MDVADQYGSAQNRKLFITGAEAKSGLFSKSVNFL
jgi:hypothetical protein